MKKQRLVENLHEADVIVISDSENEEEVYQEDTV